MIISAVNNISRYNSASFGMAKFSDKGLKLAQSCSDVYESLNNPTQYQNPEFFKKKGLLGEVPFAKYIKKTLLCKHPDEYAAADVVATIGDCGATRNSHTNAMFIKQLLASKGQLSKLDPQTRKNIDFAIEHVFRNNWNNPELSKKETFELLEMSRGVLDDLEYATLTGVIEKSNI